NPSPPVSGAPVPRSSGSTSLDLDGPSAPLDLGPASSRTGQSRGGSTSLDLGPAAAPPRRSTPASSTSLDLGAAAAPPAAAPARGSSTSLDLSPTSPP